jgi:hypothetical protein
MGRRDRLAEILTDDDVQTLKHLAREGMGENGLRALASDLAYLETWADAATGQPLPWPAAEALTLEFVAHHLGDPSKRVSDPRGGMPANVGESLRAEGLLPREVEHTTPLEMDPGSGGPALGRSGLAAAAPAREQAGRDRGCLGSVDRHLRDGSPSRYLGSRDPSLGFSSGHGRRSEVARLRVKQLRDAPPARLDPRDGNRPRYRALQSSSAEPRQATPTGRAGCFWSALRSRRCANGSSGPISEEADLPGDRPPGGGGGEGAHAAVGQLDCQTGLGGEGGGGGFPRSDCVTDI